MLTDPWSELFPELLPELQAALLPALWITGRLSARAALFPHSVCQKISPTEESSK